MSDKAHYEIKERNDTEATVQVTIGPDEMQRGLDSVYRRYAREVRIPGFRKGHVPRHLLESRFGREAFLAEAKEDLQREHVPEALTELGLRPVSTPRLDVVSEGEAEPFVFELSFAVLPDIVLPDPATIEASIPTLAPVSDEDIDQALGEVQSHFATLEEKDGETVADGDIVRVKEGEREWDTRADGEHPIGKHLIDAAIGSDVAIDEELPDGTSLQTTLTVLGLKHIVLPEIDDELAKDAGVDDLAALKTDIEEKLGAQRAEHHTRMANAAVLDALVEKTEIPLPEPFLDELVEEELERVKTSFESPSAGGTFEEYLEKREIDAEAFTVEVRDSIADRVRRELILGQAGKDLGIAIDDEELAELAKADAESRGEEPLRFVASLKANDRWDDYRSSKVNERIFEGLRNAATIKEEEAA